MMLTFHPKHSADEILDIADKEKCSKSWNKRWKEEKVVKKSIIWYVCQFVRLLINK